MIVSNCTISGTNRGISIQIRDQGSVRNVLFSGIVIQTRRFAPCWWGTAEPITITSINRVHDKESGAIENVTFENITAEGENGVFICGNHKVKNIKMRNVSITLKSISKWEKGLYDMRPGEATEVKKLGSYAFRVSGVDGLYMENCNASIEKHDDFSGDVLIEDSSDVFRT